MDVFGLPQVAQILDKDKNEVIPSSASHKARDLNFELCKAPESTYKSEYLCILNFIATKALLCCVLAKSHWSKVCLQLQAKCLEPR